MCVCSFTTERAGRTEIELDGPVGKVFIISSLLSLLYLPTLMYMDIGILAYIWVTMVIECAFICCWFPCLLRKRSEHWHTFHFWFSAMIILMMQKAVLYCDLLFCGFNYIELAVIDFNRSFDYTFSESFRDNPFLN